MTSIVLSSLVVVAMALGQTTLYAQTPTPDAKGTANPELVGALAKELSVTPKQAEGAAGALFGHAKTKLAPADWSKVSGAVPGMAGLLKAAPAMAAATGTSGVAAIAGAAGLGGLADVAGAFSKLGLKPEMIAKAVPVLTNFVTKSGGADVGQLLAGVLK
jgi:Protein of unknown function VcgC/VcgE (DUF2780)